METTEGDAEESKLSFEIEKQICRCCLTTEKRMKSAVEVQQYFMELAGINVGKFRYVHRKGWTARIHPSAYSYCCNSS